MCYKITKKKTYNEFDSGKKEQYLFSRVVKVK